MNLLLGILLLLSFQGISFAACDKQISLVTGPTYLPLVDETAADGGVGTDIVRKAFASQGYETKIAFQPWIRGSENTKKGVFDATFPYLKSLEREKNFLFSDPFYTSASKLFVLKKRNYTKSSELHGKTFCSPLGFDRSRIEPFVQRHHITLVEPVNLIACFEMLLLGRIDGVPLAEDIGWHTIAQDDKFKNEFVTLEGVGTTKDAQYYLMIAKSNPRAQEFLEVFNKGVKALKNKSHREIKTLDKP